MLRNNEITPTSKMHVEQTKIIKTPTSKMHVEQTKIIKITPTSRMHVEQTKINPHNFPQ